MHVYIRYISQRVISLVSQTRNKRLSTMTFSLAYITFPDGWWLKKTINLQTIEMTPSCKLMKWPLFANLWNDPFDPYLQTYEMTPICKLMKWPLFANLWNDPYLQTYEMTPICKLMRRTPKSLYWLAPWMKQPVETLLLIITQHKAVRSNTRRLAFEWHKLGSRLQNLQNYTTRKSCT